jgi:hypothetical protein
MIGEEWPRVLRVSTAIPTPPHDFIWRSQMETEKENGRRDQKEPRQMMQKKDNAPNNQLKKIRKMEDKKEGKPSSKKIVSTKVPPKEQEAIENPSPPYSQP